MMASCPVATRRARADPPAYAFAGIGDVVLQRLAGCAFARMDLEVTMAHKDSLPALFDCTIACALPPLIQEQLTAVGGFALRDKELLIHRTWLPSRNQLRDRATSTEHGGCNRG